jgi:hypothetical protein
MGSIMRNWVWRGLEFWDLSLIVVLEISES